MVAVGFIGLGTMGFPMAENLLNKGYKLVAYNRTSSKAQELAVRGAVAVSVPQDVARQADIVITMLSDDTSVQEVYYGQDGILSGLRPGKIIIDCSTISPGLVRRIAANVRDQQSEFLDAPVSGSKQAAVNGALLFMVGGDTTALERSKDVLSAMGSKIVCMGPSGTGSMTKLALNAMVGIHVAALAEGLSIAAKSGIDPAKFLEIVRGGAGNSRQAELKGDKILDRDFSSQFALKLMLKDLQLGSSLADEQQIPTPVLDHVKNLFQMGYSKGFGDLDLCSVIQCYEEWSNTAVKRYASNEGGSRAESPADHVPSVSEHERRKSARLHMNITLKISVYQWEQEGAFSGQQVDAQLFDLSEGGLQIRSTYPLAIDMFIVIHFPQESKLPPIIGKIIRITNDGQAFCYGCLLTGLTPYVRKQIEVYVRANLTSPIVK